MSAKLKTRQTKGGGKVRSVTDGNITVDIYSRTKNVGKYTYTVFEVADFTHGKRKMRSFYILNKAVAEAQDIARRLNNGQTLAAQIDNRDAASFGNARQILIDAGIDTALEIAVAHYVQAVKILGSDKVVEAAQDYIRRNPTERPPRTVREVANELIELKIKRLKNKPGKGKRYIEDLNGRLSLGNGILLSIGGQSHERESAAALARLEAAEVKLGIKKPE